MGFRIPRDLQMHQIVDSLALALSLVLSCLPGYKSEDTQINGLLLIQSYLQKVSLLKHNVGEDDSGRLVNLFPLPH